MLEGFRFGVGMALGLFSPGVLVVVVVFGITEGRSLIARWQRRRRGRDGLSRTPQSDKIIPYTSLTVTRSVFRWKGTESLVVTRCAPEDEDL